MSWQTTKKKSQHTSLDFITRDIVNVKIIHDTLLKCLTQIFDMYMLLHKIQKNVPACPTGQKHFDQNIHGNHKSRV